MRPQPGWMDKAACKGLTDWFVLPDGLSTKTALVSAFWSRARTVCVTCPVRIDCLRFAVSGAVPHQDECMYATLTPSRRRGEIAAMRKREACSA